MPKTINDLVNEVRKGEYPDVPRPHGERLLTMEPALISNYSIILANCLLNDIPGENAEAIFQARADLFDRIIETVNTNNFGRINRLVAIIDSLCKESMENPVCWPKRREANNVCQWAADYFSWDDLTRQEFFGITMGQPVEEVNEEAADPVDVDDYNIDKDEEAAAPTKRPPVTDRKPVQKPPKRTK